MKRLIAVEARGELAVVAIGGRDDAANGPAFVNRHRLRTPTIVFDEAMAAWEAYAIPGQPAGVPPGDPGKGTSCRM